MGARVASSAAIRARPVLLACSPAPPPLAARPRPRARAPHAAGRGPPSAGGTQLALAHAQGPCWP
eukprot:scaffold209_cov396-Prasinococcus_capsulatus_cf.AAC.7